MSSSFRYTGVSTTVSSPVCHAKTLLNPFETTDFSYKHWFITNIITEGSDVHSLGEWKRVTILNGVWTGFVWFCKVPGHAVLLCKLSNNTTTHDNFFSKVDRTFGKWSSFLLARLYLERTENTIWIV